MKKFMKIGALSLALIAVLFMLNKTNAQTAGGDVHFNITGVTNTACTYGTSWNAGTINASQSDQVASGELSTFVCTDTEGIADRHMDIQATSTVTNGATIIAATGVSMIASTNYSTTGCTVDSNQTVLAEIGTAAGTIMKKLGGLNEVCTITTDTVELDVAVPAEATLGTYTGSLLLTLPW